MNEWMDDICPAARAAKEDEVDASLGASSRAPNTSEQSILLRTRRPSWRTAWRGCTWARTAAT